MKKIFALLALLILPVLVGAVPNNLLVDSDTRIVNSKYLVFGRYPGQSPRCIAFPFTAATAITKGMPVVTSTDTTYQDSVTVTATAGDQTVIGIALNTAAIGAVVYVATDGVVPALIGTGSTINTKYATAASYGALTPTSTLSQAGALTQLSRTATCLITMETKASSSDGLIRCLIVH